MKNTAYNEAPTRRDFMSTWGLAAAGAIFSGPLFARTASSRQPIVVNLAPIAVGQEVTVAWNARAGRVLSGPARTNLSVPPYKFIAANRIVIGTI